MWTLFCFCRHSTQTCLQKILIVCPEIFPLENVIISPVLPILLESVRFLLENSTDWRYDNCTERHPYLGRLSRSIVIAFLMKSCWEVLCLRNSHSSGLSSNMPSAAHMLCKATEVIMASEDAWKWFLWSHSETICKALYNKGEQVNFWDNLLKLSVTEKETGPCSLYSTPL